MKFNDTNILDYFQKNEKEFFDIIDELRKTLGNIMKLVVLTIV